MTLKEELESLYDQEDKIKAKIRDVFRRSLEEEKDKACADDVAEVLKDEESYKIVYPISVLGMDMSSDIFRPNRARGCLVSIRPCAEEYGNKTYLGIYIGDLATSQLVSYNKNSNVLHIGMGSHNPAIFVPDLRKIIFGYESWWGTIKSIDQVRQITDEDIENTWYVKLLKEQSGE